MSRDWEKARSPRQAEAKWHCRQIPCWCPLGRGGALDKRKDQAICSAKSPPRSGGQDTPQILSAFSFIHRCAAFGVREESPLQAQRSTPGALGWLTSHVSTNTKGEFTSLFCW